MDRFARPQLPLLPSLPQAQDVLKKSSASSTPPTLIPLYATIPADLLTPTGAYLRLSAADRSSSSKDQNLSSLSFLYESAETTGTIGRYSFVGAFPRRVIASGPLHGKAEDPLPTLEKELSRERVATVPGLVLPPLTGGAIGYVGYDCVRYFEPKTARDDVKDVLKVPESLFMLFDTIVAFDHFFGQVKVISYIRVPESSRTDETALENAYNSAAEEIYKTVEILSDDLTPRIPQPDIIPDQEYTSNIGQRGYEQHVTTLKKHIVRGDIIQAVPSQRLARPTTLHPFNIYRHLRTVNPSPYLFYINCADFYLIGASPELLVKEEDGRIITHPIAGTVKRGKSPEEDELLADELRNSLKDRAEHVMLVDLARNDINRVCDPLSTRVDRLMVVQKFSHVQHLVSQVSGVLRPEQTRWDAFRSIFPAGTVSGAPKVKAMELIAELEREKRGVYAGAVGYFGFDKVSADGSKVEEGAMDTCIALRTMMVKDGIAYLQAGGGIVFDSDPYDEYIETMNKLGANIQCIKGAETKFLGLQKHRNGSNDAEAMKGTRKAHIDLAAG